MNIYSYYHTNTQHYFNLHRQVFNKFKINVKYFTEFNYNFHYQFLDYILMNSTDYCIFFDIDCIPMNIETLNIALDYIEKGYIVGNLQFSSHLKTKSYYNMFHGKDHNYCAPSFLGLSIDSYKKCGSPSTKGIKKHCDVAQYITTCANNNNVPICQLYPTDVKIPKWRNSSYYIGIGTTYENGDMSTYHHFESRKCNNFELFQDKCNSIIRN